MTTLNTLEKTARKSGEVLLSKFRSRTLASSLKADDVPGAQVVSEADKAAQSAGEKILRAELPNAVLISEEDKERLKKIPQRGVVVVFDPCDGTSNFVNGSKLFGVTLCALRDGYPQDGVIYLPNEDMMISATRGKGWFINGKRQPKMKGWSKDPKKVLFGTDLGQWTIREVYQPLSQEFNHHSLMASVYGAYELLMGITALYWNINVAKIWDGAAFALTVEEAGGVVCDPWGNPLRFDSYELDWVAARNRRFLNKGLKYSRSWGGRKS